MSKRITILADTFVPGESPDQPQRVAYAGAVLDVDDHTAGMLRYCGKARLADAKIDKLNDPTKAREAAKEAARARAAMPDMSMVAMVAAAVKAALAPAAAA